MFDVDLNREVPADARTRRCAVRGCRSASGDRVHLHFYKLPEQKHRFKKWIKLIGRFDLASRKRFSFNFVCEEHFSPDDFMKINKRKVLTKEAVPTLNLPTPPEDGNDSSEETPTQLVNKGSQCRLGNAKFASTTKSASVSNVALSRHLISKRIEHRDNFDLLCDNLFPKEIAKLFKQQSNVKHKLKKEKHTLDYKHFCLSFYHTSPAAYMALQKCLSLPPKKLLGTIFEVAATRGISMLFRTLRPKIDCMSELGKNCIVLIKQVKLKPHLYYNISEDKIYGFCECKGMQTPDLATYAIIVMLRGIYEQWSLPVGHVFVRSSDCFASEFFQPILSQAVNSGLKVRVCVSNMRSRVITETSNAHFTIEKPFFYIKGTKIFHAYDPIYLIQNFYGFFQNHEFHFQGSIAKWQDILQFYENDSKKVHRLVPELSERHVRPSDEDKMKSNLAVETMSERVAAGISNYVDFGQMNASAMGTVKILTVVSRLYQFMNSSKASNSSNSSEYQKPYSGSKFQMDFVVETLTFFRELKVIRGGVDVTQDIKFLKQIQITIRAVILLFEDLRSEFPIIYTNNLRLNILDSMLEDACKKSKTNKITPWNLVSTHRKLLYKNVFKTPNQKSFSWINDMFYNFLNDSSLEDVPQKSVPVKVASIYLPIKISDYKYFKLPAKEQAISICQFLLSSCWKRHVSCSMPARISHEYVKLHGIFSGANIDKTLTPIPENMINFVIALDNKLEKNFKEYFKTNSLMKATESNKFTMKYNPPCDCFPVKYMSKLFYRLRISQQLKTNNRRLKNCQSDGIEFQYKHLF